MDNTEHPDGGLPERAVTPNMIAAYNMARWRKAMGMTQEELGAELGGWTKGAVSAAEKTWDGKEGRGRKFDVDLICELASICGVPVGAFFIPPPEDRETVRYVIKGAAGDVDMESFFSLLWPEPDFDADTAAGSAYQQAVISAMAKYGSSETAKDIAESMDDRVTAEEIENTLREAGETRKAIAGLYSLADRLKEENEFFQEALSRALARKREEQ